MDTVISGWSSSARTDFTTTVIPDGCRDLIVKVEGNNAPYWFISPLFDQSQRVRVEADSKLVGFRLQPGALIQEAQLLTYINQKAISPDQVPDFLEEFVSTHAAVDEVLACLASSVLSIQQAASDLGVSVRTLQRLLRAKTGRTPGYWFRLARVRKAARALGEVTEGSFISLADTAELYGFSDQPHMNREFRHWFGATPTEIQRTPVLLEQLNDAGYG